MLTLSSFCRTLALALLALCTVVSPVRAAAASISPGEYISLHGATNLSIEPSKSPVGLQHYQFTENGLDGTTCTVQNTISKERSYPNSLLPGKLCVIRFWEHEDYLEVRLEADACKNSCGKDAHVNGFYHIPAIGCDDVSRQRSREDFKRLYDNNEYEAALSLLNPLVTACSLTMRDTESAEIKNDIAITQFHLGRLSDCRKTLDGISYHKLKNEVELKRKLSALEFDTYLPIARATWYNFKLCKQPK